MWAPILRVLALTWMLGLVLIPLSSLMQQQYDKPPIFALNFVGGVLFVLQPYVDAFLVAGLSALSASWIRGPVWAKVGAYSLSALSYGVLNGISSLWMMFRTPMGTFAALFIPLGHWMPLAGAIVPGASLSEPSQPIALLTM